MLEVKFSREIVASFGGTILALLSAGLVWLLKSALDKHKSEVIALAKYERGLSTNLEILHDNFDFLDQWVDSIKKIIDHIAPTSKSILLMILSIIE